MVRDHHMNAHVISGGGHVAQGHGGAFLTGAFMWMLYATEGCHGVDQMWLGLTSVGVIGWHDEVG